LLHRRDPYSPEVTSEIQNGFSGSAALSPTEDKVTFAYPLYIALLLAPLISLDFATVKYIFTILDWLMAALSVPLWASALGLRLSRTELLIFTVATASSFPVLAGVLLQQLSVLVLPLLGLAFLCLERRKLLLAGSLLAFATVKPQLAVLPILLLLVWAGSRFRERKALIVGLAITLIALLGACEVILPGWPTEWLISARAYANYTAPSLLEMLVGHHAGGVASLTLLLVFSALAVWTGRRHPYLSDRFLLVFAFGVLVQILVMTNGPKSLYNQVMLLPVVMILWKVRTQHQARVLKFMYGLGTVWLITPWVIALIVVLKALTAGRPAQPTFAPFNIALFLPLIALLLVTIELASSQFAHPAHQKSIPQQSL
jgi:hypothetical protein